MRIRRLEIIGFKSFCDKTVVRFSDPITGIVGPNGCGKSNVVDAIRWCMGEQSAKHLRGKAMQDVIFAGSDKRGPLGVCEVSITFDNDGRIPIDYLQFSEVTVTRRLFRDGTSEYYINKTPCRLRDITELFLGTGIGTRAYSIIEQGRVSQIISAKPEDRRFLIEEAAGITKYKLRKKAAEQKLAETGQNLLRLSDVIAEQERQLASLKRQADKAERYKRFRAELRDIELWGSCQKWLGLYLEERVYVDLVSQSAEILVQIEAARLSIEAELAAGRLSLSEEEARLAQLQEELYVVTNSVKLSEAENEHAKREEQRLLDLARKLRGEQEMLSERATQASAEQENLRAEQEKLREEDAGRDDKTQVLETQLREKKEALSALQRTTDAHKAEVTRQHKEIARAESEEKSLLRQTEDIDHRLLRMEEETKRLRDRKLELDDEMSRQQERLGGLRQQAVDLQKSKQDAEERQKDLKLITSRLSKEVEHAKSELHKKKARLHSLSELAARHEGFSLGSRMLQKRAAEKVQKPMTVADLIVAPAELEGALDAVLGEKLGALLVPTHREASEAIGYLREQGEGRAFLIPEDARPGRPGDRPMRPDAEQKEQGVRGRLLDFLEKKPGYDGVLDALLGSVLVVDSLDHAVAYYQAASEDGSLPPAACLVTLDGVLLDGHGVLQGGAQKGQGASVLAVRRELRELGAQVEDMQKRLSDEEEQLSCAKQELSLLQESLAELQQAGHKGDLQLLSLDKDLLKAREEHHRVCHRLETVGTERDELSARRDELAREAEEVRLSLRSAREQLEVLEEQLECHSRSQVTLFDAVEHVGHELTQIKVSLAAHREKALSLERAQKRLQEEESERNARMERLAGEETDCYKRTAQLANESQERSVSISEKTTRRAVVGEELHVLRNLYEQKRGEITNRELELRERRERESKHGKEALAHKARLQELGVQKRAIEESVRERHRVEVSEVLSDHHLRPQVSRADEERAQELRDQIDRMGEINLMAIEEWKELSERHGFLVAQKNDLESAIAQLEQAIVLINKTSRQRFQQVFDWVNAKFQELFPRCFVGGQAHLKLTGSEDVLEAGIEIFAQPPGKKNQTVELLSGGEKAMTAVALIFAIFLIKPSPFCLLDEVDAPLDEANVGRFNELVRSMTDRTQFILITHNKRTMQIADTLYGVTMEEPGASRVVSVNLHEAARLQAKNRAA